MRRLRGRGMRNAIATSRSSGNSTLLEQQYVLPRLQLFAATNPASARVQARPARQHGLPTGYDGLDLLSFRFQIAFGQPQS
jgi:hypothetical protein